MQNSEWRNNFQSVHTNQLKIKTDFEGSEASRLQYKNGLKMLTAHKISTVTPKTNTASAKPDKNVSPENPEQKIVLETASSQNK